MTRTVEASLLFDADAGHSLRIIGALGKQVRFRVTPRVAMALIVHADLPAVANPLAGEKETSP